jgi:hypothetical protein
MTTKKWTRHIYKADGREMIELNPGEAMSLNIAMTQGRISYEEVTAIRQAQKEESSRRHVKLKQLVRYQNSSN